jgi:hypothetical protein
VWQRQVSNAIVWADADSYCLSSGFRMPTIKELMSIVDLAATSGPTVDTVAFGSYSEVFWASTPASSPPIWVWAVDFSNGSYGIYPPSGLYRVRCVS